MKIRIKKMVIFTVIVALLICSLSFPAFADESCVIIDISNEADLSSFVFNYNSANEYSLTFTADVVVSAFFPDTSSIIDFKGYINGKGHTLSGMKQPLINTVAGKNGSKIYDLIINASVIKTANVEAGVLANSISGGAIENVTVKNFSMEIIGGSNTIAGGIVGSASESVISGCSVSGSITNHQLTLGTGGICGYAAKTSITNCTNSANVTGDDKIGGIVGQTTLDASNEISACSNAGKIYAKSGIAGGIAGAIESCKLTGCTNSNAVKGTTYAGGICGSVSGGSDPTLNYCSNLGKVNTTAINGAGLIGITQTNPLSRIIINNCFNAESTDKAFYNGTGYVALTGTYYKGTSDNPSDNMLSDASLKRGYYLDSNNNRVYWVGYHNSKWKVKGSSYPVYTSSGICTPEKVEFAVKSNLAYDGEAVTVSTSDADITYTVTNHGDCSDSFNPKVKLYKGGNEVNSVTDASNNYTISITLGNGTWEQSFSVSRSNIKKSDLQLNFADASPAVFYNGLVPTIKVKSTSIFKDSDVKITNSSSDYTTPTKVNGTLPKITVSGVNNADGSVTYEYVVPITVNAGSNNVNVSETGVYRIGTQSDTVTFKNAGEDNMTYYGGANAYLEAGTGYTFTK